MYCLILTGFNSFCDRDMTMHHFSLGIGHQTAAEFEKVDKMDGHADNVDVNSEKEKKDTQEDQLGEDVDDELQDRDPGTGTTSESSDESSEDEEDSDMDKGEDGSDDSTVYDTDDGLED